MNNNKKQKSKKERIHHIKKYIHICTGKTETSNVFFTSIILEVQLV